MLDVAVGCSWRLQQDEEWDDLDVCVALPFALFVRAHFTIGRAVFALLLSLSV